MKVQCPNCHRSLSIPKNYEGHKIRCAYCKEVLIATDFNPGKTVVPLDKISKDISNRKPKIDFLFKIWDGIPKPFKISFFGTFGVISALILCFYAYSYLFIKTGRQNDFEKVKRLMFSEKLYLLNTEGDDDIVRGRPLRCFSFVPDASNPYNNFETYFDEEKNLCGIIFNWCGDFKGSPVDLESDEYHFIFSYIFLSAFEKLTDYDISLKYFSAKDFVYDAEKNMELYEFQNNNWNIDIYRQEIKEKVTKT